ncbi:protein translocase subunit SecD [Zobellella endophytica]|uniref:Protein translocase subunit SecD n=1 Tax=Zobellella endophytica TaxID=2116700 RepID=A0A2P7R3Y5_9GAMM|nr:protein translocase subunit SecD [Zobellella endophytica]PSJ44924.1 protein translocase subunit SecD [Zobellella endophytica]
MLNRYPLWKYLMVIAVITISFLYAAPNLFGEDPALQVSGSRGTQVTPATLTQAQQTLSEAGIDVISAALADNQLLIRFRNTDDQLKGKDLVAETLGEDYIAALNLAPSTPSWLEAIGAGPLKLGLDLRGGVHFLMEVDMDEALNRVQEQMVQDFRTDLREQRLRYSGVLTQDDGALMVFREAETRNQAMSYLRGRYPDLVFSERDSGDNAGLFAVMSEQRLKEVKEYALQQNITIIRNRVNELGVAEPLVQRQGAERIVVQLPGIQDTARAKEILGATATLEFRLVDDSADVAAAAAGRVPPNSELFRGRDGRPVVLQKRIILTGEHIVDASSGMDEFSRPQVNISLDAPGGSRMADFTKDNVGRAMATVFTEYKPTDERDEDGSRQFRKDQEVINVATIQSRLGRSFRITGIDSMAEAQNLALLLRAGALIAPIQIVEERTIGPSLGQQNVENGLMAMVYGMLAVVLFMTIYYRKFGLVANAALLANVVIIIGVMSMVPGATMTLPGIAGIVLTIGMSVDANVLIFERIREELRDGRGVQQAIHIGYEKALGTIADANITTLITAVILFAVGTGPIKGFAVTLMIGILASMFTAIVGTRALVNLIWGGKRLSKLSI